MSSLSPRSNSHHHAFKSLESIFENQHESETGNSSTGPIPRDSSARNGPEERRSGTATPPMHPLDGTSLRLPLSTFALNSSRVGSPRSSSGCITRESLQTLIPEQLTDPVQGTTEDASISKLSAITAGYYEDPYCYHMVKHPTRRSPIMNRGYYSRVAALRKVLAAFLNAVPANLPAVQVVNIGAGLDTTYFWVTDFWSTPKVIFYEIDFLEVLSKKASLLMKKEALWNRLLQIDGHRGMPQIESDLRNETATSINDTLYFIPADIKDVQQVEKLLLLAGFSGRRPTLFVSECSLIYLPGTYSDQMIQWAATITVAPSAFVIYEQINPYDMFGKTMVKNLEQRGCPLLGIHDYPTLSDQRTRFLALGWDRVTIEDMNRIYDQYIDKFELIRIQNLELFDELEEWRLIQQHYFVAVAVKGSREEGEDNREETKELRDFGFLTELSSLWDTGRELTQMMPRFTTAELRASFGNTPQQKDHLHGSVGVELLMGSQPKLSLGPLSLLMCPVGASGLQPTRRTWSLPSSSSETYLKALEGFSGRTSTHNLRSPRFSIPASAAEDLRENEQRKSLKE